MFWNNIKTALRVLKKHRLATMINIFGLGIGIAFFTLLVAYVRDELTFDRFHHKADSTYMLINQFRDRFIGGVHHFIAEMLEQEYPEIAPGSTVRFATHTQVVRQDDRIVEKIFAFSEPGFFDMFSFDLLSRDPSRILAAPHQVVLTADTAEFFFGESDAVGQTLPILIGDTYRDFVVSGVIQKIPGNSSLRFDGLLPYDHIFDANQIDRNNNDFVTLPMFTITFLDLPDAQTVAALRTKLPAFNSRLYGPMWKKVGMETPSPGFDLLKFTDFHLSDVGDNALFSRGNRTHSLILSGIAILVLVLACFNAINLFVSQGSTRLKEMGVRKVIGARKDQIVKQVLTESHLIGAAALGVGLLGGYLLLAPFNSVSGKTLTISGLLHPQTLIIILFSVLLVSVLTGLVPALSLSRFQAADIFRGRTYGGRKSRMSLLLIVLQFAISLFFIIGSLVMTRQLNFMTTLDLGYDADNLILVRTQVPGERAEEGVSLLDVFRNELISDSRVLAVSADSGTMDIYPGSVTRRYDMDGVEHEVETFMIDPDYMRTLKIPIVAGRDFSRTRLADLKDGVLVNEAFAREFALDDPVGLRFSDFAADKLPPEYTFDPVIIGVVKDFHVYSLHVPIGPIAFGPRGFPPLQLYRNIIVRVQPGEEAPVLEKLGAIWSRVRPDLPFKSDFQDDMLAWGYRRERDWRRIVVWSTCFALIIAGMGLFGMTAVTIVRRTKETGIRKVLGAHASDILLLFTKDVLRWVIWANLLAWPIAFFVSRKWLEGFAYRIKVEVWMFALAGVLSLIIALITVGWHAVRTALSDPVQSLRYE